MRTMLCAFLGCVLLAPPAHAETELNRILATVDGEPITAHQLDAYAARLGAGDVPRDQVLGALVTEKLLEQEAKARKVSVTDADLDAYLAEIRAQNGMDETTFAEALERQGLTEAAYRERVHDELLKTQLVNQAIRARVNVPREEVERYYRRHQEEYRTGGGRTVRTIFLRVPPGANDDDAAAVEARARELAAKVKSRRAFERAAREHSEGPAAEQGGLLGTFKPGEMQDELDRVVFALPVGGVSEPVRAGGGYHVLRVDDEVDAGYRPLADVEDDIRDALYRQALEERYEDWLVRDLREAHDVEVLD